jgi:nucleoid DNA-binding protein
MNSTEAISKISKNVGMKQAEVKAVLESFVSLVKEDYRESIPLLDLGKFKCKETKARTCFDPRNGDEIAVPAKEKLVFVVSPSAKSVTTREI